jgi:hypothetical protein
VTVAARAPRGCSRGHRAARAPRGRRPQVPARPPSRQPTRTSRPGPPPPRRTPPPTPRKAAHASASRMALRGSDRQWRQSLARGTVYANRVPKHHRALYSPSACTHRQSGPGLLLDAVYHVRMKTLLLMVAVLLVAACVAVATLAPGPTRGACVDVRVDQVQREQWANLAGGGEMLQTEEVRCRSMGQRGS